MSVDWDLRGPDPSIKMCIMGCCMSVDWGLMEGGGGLIPLLQNAEWGFSMSLD
jgi:hypothetical protein